MTFIAIIAIIIVIAIVFIVFLGGGIDSRFVGVWEQSDNGFMPFDWTFNSDGSLEIMGMNFANWNVKGNQICLKMKDNELWGEYIPEGSLDEVCYDYEFSNGGNTVSLSLDGSDFIVLTKK
jgi:hypothetical protein